MTNDAKQNLTLLEVEFTQEEADAILELARVEGVTVDQLLRECAAAAVAAEKGYQTVTVDPTSLKGFPFFNTPSASVPLSA
jgi:hypothetical protein